MFNDWHLVHAEKPLAYPDHIARGFEERCLACRFRMPCNSADCPNNPASDPAEPAS